MDRSSLDKNKVFGRKHSLIDTHNRLIDLRHKFAAHNDNSGLDEAVVGVQEYGNEFVIENRYAIANPLNEYDDYRHVIAAVEDFVVIQTNKALGSLEKRLGKKIRVRNASQECPQAAV